MREGVALNRGSARAAFTLVELLTAAGIVAVLAALSLGALSRAGDAAKAARCTSSLGQLGLATQLYLGDHENQFFPYEQETAEGTLWYFGLETTDWQSGEGQRALDITKGPLYPYLQVVGKIEICPAFDYSDALWKPKYKGASWGYGYNWRLGLPGAKPARVTDLERPSQVIVLGDSAQVNTFEAPASASKPMIEEFYIIAESWKTVHFRHHGLANFVFADGHVEALPMAAGTADSRLPSAQVGRITPAGSLKYLR